MIRNVVLLYVYYHQGCEIKDIANDLDINYSTIGTSLAKAEQYGEVTTTGKKPKQYYCQSVDATEAEISKYVMSVINKYKHIRREQLTHVTGLSLHCVAKEVTRFKNLGKITTLTGQGIYLKENVIPPKLIRPTIKMSPLEMMLHELKS